MEAVLKEMLTETVMIAPYQGQNAYGQPQYGPAVPTLSRIERHFQTMLSTTGSQLTTETVIYLAEDAVVDERSQVTMPDGKVTPIEGLKPVLDEYGALDHYQLFM